LAAPSCCSLPHTQIEGVTGCPRAKCQAQLAVINLAQLATAASASMQRFSDPFVGTTGQRQGASSNPKGLWPRHEAPRSQCLMRLAVTCVACVLTSKVRRRIHALENLYRTRNMWHAVLGGTSSALCQPSARAFRAVSALNPTVKLQLREAAQFAEWHS
jgi:hypothetical protein